MNPGKELDDRLIQQYDEAIQGYEKKLRENRAEPFLSFKYYQWFALLFTEYFFDLSSQNPAGLLQELNTFMQESQDFKDMEPYPGRAFLYL